jgi:hypothetical protein
MLYLTFNDAPSGIYFGQVTDVCRYLKKEFKTDIRLLAFISIRSFSANRKKIKDELPSAIVLPMVPKVIFWRLNTLLLAIFILFIRPKRMIARGPYAAWLGLFMRKLGLTQSVCFDARGAYTAELNEYQVVKGKRMQLGMRKLEAQVLQEADFRMAVSNALVDYWRKEFGYRLNEHVVIPCTLASHFLDQLPTIQSIASAKKAMGFEAEDILVVYSGSSAGWQSFAGVERFLASLLDEQEQVKILFLAKELPETMKSTPVFRNRLIQMWVKPSEVRSFLCLCDYGLIIREESTTNRVASPVKFAEYLSCGLHVLISEHIGDYTRFVEQNSCGTIAREMNQKLALEIPERKEKERLNNLALASFSKSVYKEAYQQVVA